MKKAPISNSELPALEKAPTAEIFSDGEGSPFTNIDANLAAWLPKEWPVCAAARFEAYDLEKHLNNQEVMDYFGGAEKMAGRAFAPQQIRQLAESQLKGTLHALLKTGFSNIFLVRHFENGRLYFVGIVWKAEVGRFVPYIYRVENLYRAWSVGNRVFVSH